MRSSRTITLFAPPPRPTPTGSSPFVVSILVHVLAYGWLFFGLRNTPRISNRSTIQHFTVRILNAPTPVPQVAQTSGSHVAHFVPKASAPTEAPGASPASMPSVATQLAQLVPKSQILVQPDAPPDILLQRPTPIPPILRWTPPAPPVRTIVPAQLQKSVIANLRPTLEPPNHELTPADFKMSSTPFATNLPSLPPSTTSPIVVHGPDPARHIPETSSKQADLPTPAQIMSISNFQVAEGPVAIPLANAPGRPSISASLGTGPSVNSAATGHGTPGTRQSGEGAGQGPSAIDNKGPVASGAVGQTAANTGPAGGSGPGTGTDSTNVAPVIGGPVTRVHLPKDGQFGVVVVGSALAEQYPETVGLWAGRPVYTVYLHLGPGKAWILQYSVPPTAQTAASANGARPEAPWPYDVVQPHLDPSDYTADALMVHGFVNLAGRFERLAVVFPAEFAQAKFLLSALEQWQFRPARQNGQLAPVEVLLIIPEEDE
jgi:hypothetical protein